MTQRAYRNTLVLNVFPTSTAAATRTAGHPAGSPLDAGVVVTQHIRQKAKCRVPWRSPATPRASHGSISPVRFPLIRFRSPFSVAQVTKYP